MRPPKRVVKTLLDDRYESSPPPFPQSSCVMLTFFLTGIEVVQHPLRPLMVAIGAAEKPDCTSHSLNVNEGPAETVALEDTRTKGFHGHIYDLLQQDHLLRCLNSR